MDIHFEENVYSPESIDLLIVDDDAEFRGTVARRFKRRGFRVQEAANGEDALILADRQQFDVAILDLVMPGLSGIELLEKLKDLHPDCEAVFMTGQGSIKTAVEAMRRGAFDYLTKPFPLADLEVLIKKAYERRQHCEENQ